MKNHYSNKMPKFKFKFETISKIKDRMRVKVQKEIAEFNLKIEQKRILIEETKNEILENKKMFSSGSHKVSEIHYYERHDIHLRSKLKKFEVELRSLEYHKRIKMEDLVEKTKELKMFELLEEKHYTNYLLDQSKSENSMLDELAIQKIGRK